MQRSFVSQSLSSRQYKRSIGVGLAKCRAKAARQSRVQSGIMEHLSENAVKSIMLAQIHAKYYRSPTVQSEHLLLGILSVHDMAEGSGGNPGKIAAENTDTPVYPNHPNLTIKNIRQAIDSLYGANRMPNVMDALQNMPEVVQIDLSEELREVFYFAEKERETRDAQFITPDSLLLVMLGIGDGCRAVVVLRHVNVDLWLLRDTLRKDLRTAMNEKSALAKGSNSRWATAASSKNSEETARKLCRDLCEFARDGKIDPVFGRDKEMDRLVQVLARRQKCNPIILGEPGVGKTALVEGLAYKIVHTPLELPSFLWNKQIWQLDVAAMMAGTSERGELEKRLTELVDFLKTKRDEVILMIDEIHVMVGADGSSREGSSIGHVANILKPALARGEITCIGATTYTEFRKYFQSDAALERRFQPVYVGEPDITNAVDIIRGISNVYAEFHKCTYDEEALRAAVTLSTRYLPDRQLPDKAIDLIDEAGSLLRMQSYLDKAPDPNKEAILKSIAAVLDPDVQLPAVSRPRVTVTMIRNVISTWTGIPVDDMDDMDIDEREKLVNMGNHLKKSVIGQDRAVEAVTFAIQRARAGLRDPKRPIASFLFVGPTGVGKTELVKCLAQAYYGGTHGGEDARGSKRTPLIRLDMSEYMESHTVSRLVGAPPGYLGYEDGGKLTEAVRRNPYSVVLLDEIEKAHPDIQNVLLQILEDGRLTDARGRVVSFKNTIVVLTSNLGSANVRQADKASTVFGFGSNNKNTTDVKQTIMDAVTRFFRPELVNRFDDIIVFEPLSKESIRQIATLMLQESLSRIENTGYSVQLNDETFERICEEGYNPERGARGLRDVIGREIEDKVADIILLNRANNNPTKILMQI